MVLPIGEISVTEELEVISTADLPTKTYKLDFERGRVTGMIEGLEAIEQAIFKVLNTKRFAHMIYSDDYGFENMIGEDEIFVRGELPRRITEAVLQDERITALEDFSMVFEGDSVLVKFTAVTLYGDVNVLREVMK
ncbi:hypothetical protein PVJ1_00061 [Psychrobacillus phage PVJ1]|nr:hypothetical protein PVJ1_00061 [Psychrobacillus phage PVJ1]